MPAPNPDTLMRAAIEPAPAPGAARTPEQTLGDDLRKRVAEKESDRSVLESFKKPAPIDKAAIALRIDNNIGVTRDPATGDKVRDPAEQARFDRINNWKALSEIYLESGFDVLTPANKTTVLTEVEQAIRAVGPGDALLNAMSAAEKQTLLETVAKDPVFAQKIRATYDEIYAINLDSAPLEQAAGKVIELQAEHDRIDSELSQANTKLTDINTALARFQMVAGTAGPDLAEINAITTESTTLNANIATAQAELHALNVQFRGLELRLRTNPTDPAAQADYTAKAAEIAAKNADIQTWQDRLNRKVELENKKQHLEEEKQTTETNKVDLEGKKTVAVHNLSQGRADLASKRLARTAEETSFDNSAQSILLESTRKLLEDNMQKGEEVERARLQEAIDSAEDPAEQKVLKALGRRWDQEKQVGFGTLFGLGGEKMKKVRVFDKDQINADFSTLMTYGPRGIIRDILTKHGGLSDTEVDARMKDKAFVEKVQPQIVERLITRKVQTGKFSEDEARLIAESDWGQGMLDKALENRTKLKDALIKYKGEGIIEGGAVNWVRKLSAGELWKFILILIGGYAAVNLLPGVLGLGASAGFRTGAKNLLFPGY